MPTTTTTQTTDTLHAIATLGPSDEPNGKVRVRVLGQAEHFDFYSCETASGQRLTIHRTKLKRIEVAE